MICPNQSNRGLLEEEEAEEEEKEENKCGPLLTGRLDGARQNNFNDWIVNTAISY